MAEFPHLPWFTGAYLADLHPRLTLEEHGCMALLMQFAWRSPKCRLPDDDQKLARMLGISAARWRKLRPIMEDIWTVENGFWSQKRLSKEFEFVTERREKYIQRARQGGEAKALKDNEPGLLEAETSSAEAAPKQAAGSAKGDVTYNLSLQPIPINQETKPPSPGGDAPPLNPTPEFLERRPEPRKHDPPPEEPTHAKPKSTHAKAPAVRRGTRLGPAWKRNAWDRKYARSRGFSDAEAEDEAANFKTYFTAGKGRNTTHLRWHGHGNSAYAVWVRKSAEYRAQRAQHGGGGSQPPSVLDIGRELVAELELESELRDAPGMPDLSEVPGPGGLDDSDFGPPGGAEAGERGLAREGADQPPVIDHEPQDGCLGDQGEPAAVRPQADGVSGRPGDSSDPDASESQPVVAGVGGALRANGAADQRTDAAPELPREASRHGAGG